MITTGPHPWDKWERLYYDGRFIGNLEICDPYSWTHVRLVFEDDRGFEKSWFDISKDEVLQDIMKVVPYLGYKHLVYGIWHDYYRMIVDNKIEHHTVELLPCFSVDYKPIYVSFIMDPVQAEIAKQMEKWSKDLNKKYG